MGGVSLPEAAFLILHLERKNKNILLSREY